MLYFAYGSNLDREDLVKYCLLKKFPLPPLANERTVYLPGWKLVFNFFSATRLGGVANLMPTGQEGDRVYGAVYDVLEPYMKIIDLKEGAPRAYERRKVSVVLPDGRSLADVTTYTVIKAREMNQHVSPTKDYLSLIVRNGKRLGFPPEYLKYLESS
jgi:hypothetical protein